MGCGRVGREWRGIWSWDELIHFYSCNCIRERSSSDERKSCMVTTVSIKDSDSYIDMEGIQWKQRQAYNVYKCIQHLFWSIQCIKCIQGQRRMGRLYKGVTYVQLGQGRAWSYKDKECGYTKCEVNGGVDDRMGKGMKRLLPIVWKSVLGALSTANMPRVLLCLLVYSEMLYSLSHARERVTFNCPGLWLFGCGTSLLDSSVGELGWVRLHANCF